MNAERTQPSSEPPPGSEDPDRRRPRWRRGLVYGAGGLVVLLLGVGIGMDDGGSLERAERLEVDLAEEEDLRAELEERLEAAEERTAAAERRAHEAEERARVAMESELEERRAELEADAEASLDERTTELVDREGDLSGREAALDDREDDLASREASADRVAEAQFGDGTWEVGVDIEPGRYRTQPGDRCYWARLSDRTGGVDSIIDNNNARGGQEIVELSASDAYFESVGCGTWTPAD